jgi:3-dehydroquinate synthase
MTDAAIGGKLGIDFQGIKNTIGVFQYPAAVFADPDFLTTLSPRELQSGWAEVLKHALIGDPVLWKTLQNNLDDPKMTTELLRQSIAVKVRIVTEDPHERGLRMLLNYGHSIGHGIESYFLDTPTPLTHGEAIAIGMACESYIAADERLAEVSAAVRRFFPLVEVPESAFLQIWDIMQHDKKNVSGHVRLAVPGRQAYEMRILEVSLSQITAALTWWNEEIKRA